MALIPYQPSGMRGQASEFSDRQKCEDLLEQMRHERESWRPQWSDLAKFIEPTRSRFWLDESNRGDRRNYAIVDSTATRAARTLASGMMSGVTNPARPWFRLTTPDPELSDRQTVKDWLYEVTERMNTVIARANAYDAMQVVYGDLGTFATGSMIVEEDEEFVIRCQSFPIGSYFIADDQYGRVRYFAREFQLSVSQVVEMFGAENPGLTIGTKSLYENNTLRERVSLCHLIKPNPDYDPARRDGKAKAFISYYWEKGSAGDVAADRTRGFLRVSGYEEFPVLAPRWAVTGEDSYGTNCPGMICLGDVRQLQLGEKRKMQAVDKKISPPMQAPAGLRNQQMNFAAGGVSWNPMPTQPITPVYAVDFALQEFEFIQNQCRQRIDETYYADLFLLIARDDALQPRTATEILERREEKFIALGPVLQRLNRDFLNPFIDRVFNVMARRGFIPEPPEELAGVDLRVEFISIMAQAQKLAGVGGVERYMRQVVETAAATRNPAILDVVNFEEGFPEYGEMLGIPPTFTRSYDEIIALRDARAEAETRMRAAEEAKVEAEALQKMSQAKTGPGPGDNLLASILGNGGQVATEGLPL